MPTSTKSPAPARQRSVSVELIERRIYLIRGEKVMLSPGLAELYHVETRALVQAVKRNLDRFPADFMFQLTDAEFENLKSQSVISSWGGARRATPYAFTELGVAMLSSVLTTKRAVRMNIFIMRAFVKLRSLLATHQDLARKMQQLEARQKDHEGIFAIVIQDIRTLAKSVKREFKKLKAPPKRKPRIGFNIE